MAVLARVLFRASEIEVLRRVVMFCDFVARDNLMI